MAKIWTTPWAATGDKNVIPDAAQPDGSVSNTTGWTFDYERPYVDPLAKDIVRDDMNGVLYAITDGLGEVQKQGAPNWSVDAAPYPIHAVVYHLNKRWSSSISNNSNTPGDVSNTWVDFSAQDPTTTVRGMPLLASNAQADAGTNDTAMLSPAKGLRLIRAAISQATDALLGTLRIGTQAEVNAGSLDTVAVTPLKLRFGFSASIAQNGHIRFPEWLGSLTIQWGNTPSSTAAIQTRNFSIPYTTAAFAVVGSTGAGNSSALTFQIHGVTLTGFNWSVNNSSNAYVSGLTPLWISVGR